MAVAARRTSQRVTLLMLVLASVTVLTLDYHGEANHALGHVRNGVRDALSPIQRVISDVLHPIGNVFAGAFRYGSLQTQNQRLQDQVSALSLRLAQSAGAATQLQQLEALDHLHFTGSIPGVVGRVISAPTSDFQYTLEIDRGTSSGIGPGMPVVGGKGFVGTVLSASSGVATIQLVTDARSRIGVRFGASSDPNALGVLSGQGPDNRLATTTTHFAPKMGQVAYTSGLAGELYPPGLPVGVVTSSRPASGGLAQSVEVTPLVDIQALQFVRVLLWTPPA